MSAAPRRLIVNADDFGLTEGINAGIVQAHEEGIVTSTSLMVHGPAAAAAAAYARAHPRLGLGLHVDLWEWVWHDDGQWQRLYTRVAEDEASVVQEMAGQLARFRDLVGRDPDHLNSHQHVHRLEPVGGALRALAHAVAVPLRGQGPWRYLGGFYGQTDTGEPYPEGVSPERLIELLDALEPGITEFGCHPGLVADDDPLGGTMYRSERRQEVQTLCHPDVRARMARGDIQACTFADCADAVKRAG